MKNTDSLSPPRDEYQAAAEDSAMTAAALPFDLVLHAIATHQALTIRRDTTLDAGIGDVDFDTATITIAPLADPAETRCAITAGLIHLCHGPAAEGHEEAEERQVHEEVARLLVPRSALPAMLDTADPDQVARELLVDLPTARLGIALARAEEAHPTEDE